ncbi:tRNA modification GTPase [Mucisphaera sp.]|uniref:tRNA modification GTPase n=1 Tax=Mucisphaera sp. TaxID=2913024 RepID=UPI003D0C7917
MTAPQAGSLPALKASQTIAAIASPPGHAPRGLLRISGPKTTHVLNQLTDTTTPTPRHLTPVRLKAPLPSLPAMAAYFPGPNSFTGEDTAELWLPGNPTLLDRVLTQALTASARIAEPGEFSFRAHHNARITLEQAEGIAATIAAESTSELTAAAAWRQGQLGATTHRWMLNLADLLALVEAGIDFTDQEDVVSIATPSLIDKLKQTQAAITTFRTKTRAWSDRTANPSVVLAGPPSAGKSTLFNTLLGEHRAIIHEDPGTTRDRLEAHLTLTSSTGQTLGITLIDLAGLTNEPDVNTLDTRAQQAARQTLTQADLILLCTPADHPTPFELETQAPTLTLLTKADLLNTPPNTDNQQPLPISTKTGLNLDTLRTTIADTLSTTGPTHAGQQLALNPRHLAALTGAQTAIDQTLADLSHETPTGPLAEPELIASGLRDALDHLGQLAGRVSEDDIIGRVFATFCVGK